MPFQNILCPVDFSEHSRLAMNTALDLAREGKGSVTLFHVWSFPPSLVAAPEMPVFPTLTQDLAQDAEKRVSEWKRDAQALGGVKVATLVTGGVPWNAIAEESRRQPYDLVVVGSHGRTGLKHAFMGSVAERVVRHAACPVLVVRARS